MQEDRKPSAEPPSEAKFPIPPPGPERIVTRGAGPVTHQPHLLARLLARGGVGESRSAR